MKNLTSCLLFVVGSLGLQAGTVSSLHSTGTSPENTQDPFWTIVSSPYGALTPWVSVTGDYPMGIWNANTSSSKWIMPVRNVPGVDSQALGIYDYQTHFDLSGFDANSFNLRIDLGLDDHWYGLFLNGHELTMTLVPGSISGWMAKYDVAFGSFLNAGINTLDAKVGNTGYVTGFRFGVVEATAMELQAPADAPGASAVPEPSTYAYGGVGILAGLSVLRRRRKRE